MAENRGLFFSVLLVILMTTRILGGCFSQMYCPPRDTCFCSPDTFDRENVQRMIMIDALILKGCIQNNTYYFGKGVPSSLSANLYTSCTTVEFRSKECKSCLEEAVKVIEERCPNRVGAQYASEKCCIRYETKYEFCQRPSD